LRLELSFPDAVGYCLLAFFDAIITKRCQTLTSYEIRWRKKYNEGGRGGINNFTLEAIGCGRGEIFRWGQDPVVWGGALAARIFFSSSIKLEKVMLYTMKTILEYKE
jgi:hypothetical protein